MPGPHFAAYSVSRARRLLAPILALGLVLVAGYAPVQAPQLDRPLPLLGRTIMLDPGHGGIDPGCHRGQITEKDVVLRVALTLAHQLRNRGATVAVTRDEDVELSHLSSSERTRHRRDLSARVLLAQRHGAEFLISLHVNTAASSNLGGAIVFYHPGSDEGRRLAENILDHLRQTVPGNQNGVLPGNFYILRHASMPAVLVEMGFMSHPQDRRHLLSPDSPQMLAEAIVQGVEAYVLSSRERAPGTLDTPPVDGHGCASESALTSDRAERFDERPPQ